MIAGEDEDQFETAIRSTTRKKVDSKERESVYKCGSEITTLAHAKSYPCPFPTATASMSTLDLRQFQIQRANVR